mmetsp:Transcript_26546/g.82032  ORF Transcript_26546/g.82032 Transcript_26546/m.82032 type:complete len:318 (-) Transcript_26546:967-1920(-)
MGSGVRPTWSAPRPSSRASTATRVRSSSRTRCRHPHPTRACRVQFRFVDRARCRTAASSVRTPSTAHCYWRTLRDSRASAPRPSCASGCAGRRTRCRTTSSTACRPPQKRWGTWSSSPGPSFAAPLKQPTPTTSTSNGSARVSPVRPIQSTWSFTSSTPPSAASCTCGMSTSSTSAGSPNGGRHPQPQPLLRRRRSRTVETRRRPPPAKRRAQASGRRWMRRPQRPWRCWWTRRRSSSRPASPSSRSTVARSAWTRCWTASHRPARMPRCRAPSWCTCGTGSRTSISTAAKSDGARTTRPSRCRCCMARATTRCSST